MAGVAGPESRRLGLYRRGRAPAANAGAGPGTERRPPLHRRRRESGQDGRLVHQGVQQVAAIIPSGRTRAGQDALHVRLDRGEHVVDVSRVE